MFESIINSLELEIPCKFVLRTEFYFFLFDRCGGRDCLRRFQNPNRNLVEEHCKKINDLLKSKEVLKLDGVDYPTNRLYTSEIEQCLKYKLFVNNEEIPLHNCVNVVMDKLVEDTLTTNTIAMCTLISSFDTCDHIDTYEYFEKETLCYDSDQNNFHYL